MAAESAGVTLIDLWKAIMDTAIAKTPGFDTNGPLLGHPEGVRGYLEHLLPDGLHLSSESYRIFYDIVRSHIPGGDRVLPDWQVAPWLEEDAYLKG